MKKCKECKHLKLRSSPIEALRGRQYHCSKYSMGTILKKPEDVEKLECIDRGRNY